MQLCVRLLESESEDEDEDEDDNENDVKPEDVDVIEDVLIVFHIMPSAFSGINIGAVLRSRFLPDITADADADADADVQGTTLAPADLSALVSISKSSLLDLIACVVSVAFEGIEALDALVLLGVAVEMVIEGEGEEVAVCDDDDDDDDDCCLICVCSACCCCDGNVVLINCCSLSF
jgi:hypothetical protein